MPFLTFNDIELYYECHGAGTPLLLLHGLGSSTRDWARQVDAFADRYQVVALDVRGHGQSAKPPGPYSVAQFAQDAAAVLTALALPPAHVVGVSMGGMAAFQLAVDRPELIRSLVIVNSGPELIPRTIPERLAIWQRFIILRFMGMRKMGEVLAPRLFTRPEQDEERAVFVERWAENDKRAYTDSLRALVGWSVQDRIKTITAPVLVMASENDYTPLSLKEAYMPLLQNGQLVVIPDATHAAPMDRPAAFNEALAEFLARVDA